MSGSDVSPRVAYFTVADERYFLGALAMVTSLRVTGNTETIVVLDAGLRDEQRAVLQKSCHLVTLDPSERSAANATYYKLVAPSVAAAQVDADVVVLVDSDMIVTAALSEVRALASAGKIVAFPDPEADRWYAEWEAIFELPAPPRHQTYVNAGFVAFSRTHHPELLERWMRACRSIAEHPTIAEGATGPTSQADQDALNAILMSHYRTDVVELLPAHAAPQANDLAAGVAILDEQTLACRYRDTPTVLLHAAGGPKPWRSWQGMRRTAYSVLLVAILAGVRSSDAAPHLPLPWWLRAGVVGDAVRQLLHVWVAGRGRVRHELQALSRQIGASGR